MSSPEHDSPDAVCTFSTWTRFSALSTLDTTIPLAKVSNPSFALGVLEP
jgi:hypothetical protein